MLAQLIAQAATLAEGDSLVFTLADLDARLTPWPLGIIRRTEVSHGWTSRYQLKRTMRIDETFNSAPGQGCYVRQGADLAELETRLADYLRQERLRLR